MNGEAGPHAARKYILDCYAVSGNDLPYPPSREGENKKKNTPQVERKNKKKENNIIKQLLFLERKVTKERNMKDKEKKPIIWESKQWIFIGLVHSTIAYEVIKHSKN